MHKPQIKHTSPGIHPDFRMDQYPSAVQMSIRRMADHFYVTRGFRPIEIGNSVYYAALVRPTDETSVYLNTQRELVTIFAEYENFEVRTLEAFEEAYSHVESSRIDDSVRFLISGDPAIEEHIRHYLSTNPEYPIVIPLHDEKLSFSGGRPLVDSIQRNYVIRDLFGFQAPLRQEYFFFGRQKTVNDVIDLAKSGQNSSLFGLRKSGKTSTIYAVQRKSKSFNINVVNIDCQNPAIHARRYNELLSYILNEVRRVIGIKQKINKFSENLGQFADEFSKEFTNSISSAKGQVLIIFDEIENISPQTAASEHWRTGNDPIHFWQILRSMYQSQTKTSFNFCIVGTSPKLLETAKINGIDNPLYLFAQKKFIPSLQYQEVSEMLTKLGFFMGMDFADSTKTKIYDLYGGHPFFTRQLCSTIHQSVGISRPIQISKAELERAQDKYGPALEQYLVEILRSLRELYEEEFKLLASAIRGDDKEFSEFIREAPELLDHLTGYGLVRRIGHDYELSYSALKPALFKAYPEYIISPESSLAEISKRRNVVEQLIRKNLYFWARDLELESFKKILKDSLTSRRYEGLESFEPKRLFSNDVSPLYLTDLIALIGNSEVLKSLLKDCRSEVKNALNILNINRKDAHALNVAPDDLEQVRDASELIEEIFYLP